MTTNEVLQAIGSPTYKGRTSDHRRPDNPTIHYQYNHPYVWDYITKAIALDKFRSQFHRGLQIEFDELGQVVAVYSVSPYSGTQQPAKW